MMKRHTAIALTAGLISLVWVFVASGAERLDRGLIALQRDDGSVFLSWRLLDDDPVDITFRIARRSRNASDTAPVVLTGEGYR